MKMILEQLESVLCNPEGRCCIVGTDADRAEVDAALDKLRTLVNAAKEFDEAPEDAEWSAPHPIFQMAADNDRLNDELAQLRIALDNQVRLSVALQSWQENVLTKVGPAPADEYGMTNNHTDHYKAVSKHLAAKLVDAEQRIKEFEEADTTHLPYEKGWQDGRADAWEAYNAIAQSQPPPTGERHGITPPVCPHGNPTIPWAGWTGPCSLCVADQTEDKPTAEEQTIADAMPTLATASDVTFTAEPDRASQFPKLADELTAICPVCLMTVPVINAKPDGWVKIKDHNHPCGTITFRPSARTEGGK